MPELTVTFRAHTAGKTDLLPGNTPLVQRMEAAKHEVAMAVFNGMKIRAPVLTGFLKNSIVMTEFGTDIKIIVGAFYGIYVNFGTRNMAPQPFFTQAVRIDGVNAMKIAIRNVVS